MVRLLASLLAILAIVFSPVPASAQTGSITQIEQQMAEKLKIFDPSAVKAAVSYLKITNMTVMLGESVKLMLPGLTNLISSKNPGLSKQDIALFVDEFMNVAIVGAVPFLENWALIAMLEVFSKDELVAFDAFYGSEVGRSINGKIPKIMERTPQLMSFVEQQSGNQAISRKDFDARMKKEFSRFSTEQVNKVRNAIKKSNTMAQYQQFEARYMPYIEELVVLSYIEVLDKNEIDAFDKFIVSGAGASAMGKMQKFTNRFREMYAVLEQHFFPAGMAAAISKLRAVGKDIKI